jgi:hypothetical protein
MRRKKKTPIDVNEVNERLARAQQAVREAYLHLDEVAENVSSRFSTIHTIFLFFEGVSKFRACIFFKTNKDVTDSNSDSTMSAIEDAVYEELDRYGRGKRGEIEVVFEIDSHDNIQKKFNGNYWKALH